MTKLGFNTDVFMGKFEDSRYIQDVAQEFEEKKLDEYKKKLEETKSLPQLKKVFTSMPVTVQAQLTELKDELKQKYEDIKLPK